MRFWLRLILAYFCSYLHILDVVRYFVPLVNGGLVRSAPRFLISFYVLNRLVS